MAEKDVFNAEQFLTDNGMTLQGPGKTPGTVSVLDADGNQQEFAMQKFLADNGIKNADVQYNTPETAAPASPVGVWDRFKLSIGTDQGRENFLRKNFEDVAYDPEQGLKVKNKGVWQQVDPRGLGIGGTSDKAWELAKDLADWAKPATQAVAGGAAATAGLAAGPAGSIAAAAASGAATEAAFTSLGRLVGTYDASIEDQIKDVAFETVLSAGGQGLSLGVRPTGQWLKANLKGLGKASDGVKEVASEVFARTTGTAPGALKVAMEHPDDVVKLFDHMKRTGTAPADISYNITKPAAEEFLDKASKELPNRFRGALNAAMSQAKPGSKVNMGTVVEDFSKNVEALGLGVFDKTGRLLPLSETQLAGRAAQGMDVPSIPDDVFKNLQKMAAPLQAFRKTGEVAGPKAVELLSNLNKSINQVSEQFAGNVQDASNRRLAAEIKNAFKSAINPQLDKVGAAAGWREAMQLYGRYGDAVTQARTIMNSDKGVLGFGEQLLADSRAGRSATGLSRTLMELTGAEGEALHRRIVTAESARQLGNWVPKFSGANLASSVTLGTGLGAGIGSGAIDPMSPEGAGAIGLAATVSSPRAVFNVLRYGLKSKQFVMGLGKSERAALLQNPAAMQAVLQAGEGMYQQQQSDTQQLLQQTGVIPSGTR